MTAVLRFHPVHYSLILSGLVHLGLLVLLAWTTTTAWKGGGRVEISLIESGTAAMRPAPAVAVPSRRRVARSSPPVPAAAPADSEPETAAEATARPAVEPGGGAAGEGYGEYESRVMSELNRHKSYPAMAMKLRQQGRVKVRFRVGREGRIMAAEIVEKSPFDLLNQAAETLVTKIRAFPPFPAEMRATSWVFTVPIEYSL